MIIQHSSKHQMSMERALHGGRSQVEIYLRTVGAVRMQLFLAPATTVVCAQRGY